VGGWRRLFALPDLGQKRRSARLYFSEVARGSYSTLSSAGRDVRSNAPQEGGG